MRILEIKKIDIENYNHITFIRIDPENLELTIKEIIEQLFSIAWISRFDKAYMKISFEKRAIDTAQYLAKKIRLETDDKVSKDTGEYVVSELARKSIIEQMGYLDIPLAEIFKEQVSGNPGFDYYSANANDTIIFGEAKYLSAQNAYGKGMEQVDRFIKKKQDISDLNDIDKFFKPQSLDRAGIGKKAYSIAFSSKKTNSDRIIDGITSNRHYKELIIHEELIFVAVDI